MSERAADSDQSSDSPDPSAGVGDQAEGPAQTFAPGEPFQVANLLPTPQNRRTPQLGRGRRSYTIATDRGGHYIRATIPPGPIRDVALMATLRAAALRQSQSPHRPTSPSPHLPISRADLRVKVRRSRTGNLILFVVDASGSMGARKRMVAVKGAILSLLLDAYQKRDKVGLIAFRGPGAEVLVPPTNSVELAERSLRQLPTGGRTPLAAGLQLATQTLGHYLQRDAALTPLLVLITDGRANAGPPAHLRQVALNLAGQRIAGLVLDSEQGYVRLGAARELAGWLGAEYLPLDRLGAEAIVGQVRRYVGL